MARGLLRVGITPDAVTVAGTVGILVASALAAFGHFLVATIIATLSAFTDILDGSMARARGTTSAFGAFLDSTMDRVADGAIFAALAYWAFTNDETGAAVAGGRAHSPAAASGAATGSDAHPVTSETSGAPRARAATTPITAAR